MDSASVQIATDDPSPNPALLQGWCQQALDACNQQGELTIRVVNKEEITLLNQQYRNKTGPTNVLSFPANLPKDVTVKLLGDIIICAEIVNTEARAQNKENAAHWAHMVVHGTLHLCGFDHQQDDEAKNMEAQEQQILGLCGFANPYANESEVTE